METTTQTSAEQLAARFNDDGSCWTDADGVDLSDALLASAAERIRFDRHPDTYRYQWPDGSPSAGRS